MTSIEHIFWILLLLLAHMPDRIFSKEEWTRDIRDISTKPSLGAPHFLPGFLSSLSVTLVSEFGDKTFFIAAILAMRNSRLAVFFGSSLALLFMTILSVTLGFVANSVPVLCTRHISLVIFLLCGLKMIHDAYRMNPDDGLEDFYKVEKTILSSSEKTKSPRYQKDALTRSFSQALTMCFVAEWGDRSQISTVVLATRSNILGVSLGTILAHSVCTLLAVVSGRFVAQKISLKAVTYIGGFVFLSCAIFEFLSGNEEVTSNTIVA